MSRLRFKRIAACDTDCTPHILVLGADGGREYPCKVQQILWIDTDNDNTYWEWQDVELIVQGDADDYETQSR